MANNEIFEDVTASAAVERPVSAATTPKGRPAFAKVSRELSTEEFGTAAVQKLLMDDIDRLQNENDELKVYVNKFHDADKKAATLEKQLDRDRSNEALFAVSLAGGAALLGLVPTAWKTQPVGWLLILFGVVLLLGSTVTRFKR